MNKHQFAGLAAGLLAGALCSAPAYAQFGFAPPSGYGVANVAPTPQNTSKAALERSINISVYPWAQYSATSNGIPAGNFAGPPPVSFPGTGTISASASGPLLAAEARFGGEKKAWAVGGWVWTSAYTSGPTATFVEVHGKYYLNKYLGLQGSVYPSNIGAPGYYADVLGTVTSNKKASHPWALQGGVGPFFDTSSKVTTVNIVPAAAGQTPLFVDSTGTGFVPVNTSTSGVNVDVNAFVDASITLYKKLSFDASFFYYGLRNGHVTRIATGFGYKL